MASAAERPLRASVLDRLLDPLGEGRREPTIGVRELKAAVARDLEWLLNTKTVLVHDDRLAALTEARESILTYGLPDFTTSSWRNPNDTRRICGEIAAAIKAFEPRLAPSTVRVSLVPARDALDFRTRFRIEATLCVEPISEPVYFDSSVQFGTGAIQIEETS